MTFIEQFPTVFVALNQGFLQTLKLFVVTLLGALPLGLIISFGSMSKFKPLSAFVKTIVWLFRGSPLMIQLLIVYYFPGLILGNNWWGSGEEGRFIAASVAFILNYACYFSEIFRGGIESIPQGQYEAGQVLGLTKGQIFRKIILKQVVKRILPPMSNEIITLVKDTALANVIAIPEIIKRAKDMAATQALTWPLFYTAVFYLLFVGLMTLLLGYAEKKLSYFKA
jgi:polar amino acid transport system permease protein